MRDRRPVFVRLLLLTVLILNGPAIRAGSLPLLPALPVSNGPVLAQYVVGDMLYIAGDFTQVGTQARNGLAGIDLVSGNVLTTWNPGLGDGLGAGVARVLLPSSDRRTLYVGGSFATVLGNSHNLLAAIDIYPESSTYGNVPEKLRDWDPQLIGNSVNTLAWSLDGRLLYVGGDYSQVGTDDRQNLAAITLSSAQATPWLPEPDGVVHSLLLAADRGRLYVGGEFTKIGSSADARAARTAVAALNVSNAAVLAWDAGVSGVTPVVYDIERSSDGGSITVAGLFDAAGGAARSNLARLDVDSALVDAWVADTNGVVNDLVRGPSGHLLVAGDYTEINNDPYNNLSMLGATGIIPLPWKPAIALAGSVSALVVDSATDIVYVGGNFADVGGDITHNNLAAFLVAAPITVSDPGGQASMGGVNVTLSCIDHHDDSPCAQTYYTLDDSEPSLTSTVYAGAINIGVTTTLKFFSVDVDGAREAVRSELFTIETDPPETTASPGLTVLNGFNYRPVELLCDDGVGGSGCATSYYTKDGSEPTTGSTIYSSTAPIELINGTTQIRYFSVDKAGNVEASQSIEYILDLDLPQITVSHANGNYTPPLTVTVECKDVGSGCDVLYISVDGEVPETTTDPITYSNSKPIERTFTTATVLRVFAADVAGNSGGAIVGIYSFTAAEPLRRSSSGTGALLWLPALLALMLFRRRKPLSVMSKIKNK